MGLFRFRKKKEEVETSVSNSKDILEAKVSKVINETEDSVVMSFDINGTSFQPIPGQYINITSNIAGEKVVRSYSLCSSKNSEEPAVGVKKVAGGKMSTFLTESVKEGDVITISQPQGNFKLEETTGRFVAIVAGSGITPVQSMIESNLGNNVQWDLYYGNRKANNIMFYDRLESLKSDQIKVTHYLSQDDAPGFHQGRINEARIEQILTEKAGFDGLYLCGPEALIQSGISVAEKLAIDKSKVHYELFTTPVSLGKDKQVENTFSEKADCTVIVDGDEYNVSLKPGELMLTAFEEAGIDAPFSCKGAVCCTCKAKVTDGSADMVMNHSLGDDEVGEGYILTCQGRATSSNLTVDFDQ